MLGNSKPVILIPTAKKDEAKEFYGSTLGLEFERDDGFALVFHTGGNMLRITPVKEFQPHSFAILGWEVEDIASTVKGLNEKGVMVEIYDLPWLEQDELGIWTAPDGTKVGWFKDLDGNLLSVSEHAK